MWNTEANHKMERGREGLIRRLECRQTWWRPVKKGPAKEEGCDEHKRGKGKKTKQPYAQRRTRATGAVINGIKGGGMTRCHTYAQFA